MAQRPDVRQTIVELLSNMSDGKEIRTYLQRFSEIDKSRFAVIKVGGAILRDRLDETAAALAFLHTVGLTPIVLHGGGPQLDDRLEAVRAQGVAAHGLTQGAFDADFVDRDRYGFVGEPNKVHLDLIRSVVNSGAIPILTCLGVAPGGQLVNMNADSATRLLVHAVQPMKIIFLVDSGGLLDGDGEVIDSINLASDYEDLMAQDWVHSGMRLKLAEVKGLLDDSPSSTSVSITTPSALVRELFTHGGAGTMVRKGELILKMTAKPDLDGDRIVDLVESAFRRALTPGWWDEVNLVAAYVSESYRAAAIVSVIDDFTYLDKFVVDETARGEGVARTVWTHMTTDFPILFWRSRLDNGFNAFYANECDGSVKRNGWTVFWRGESDFDRIALAVKRLSEFPADFDLEPIDD